MKKVVWILDGDKAPGPDRFTIAFYEACWEVIKEDLMLVFHDFHEKCFLDKGSNATYIALIPRGRERISCPISDRLVWWEALIKSFQNVWLFG